MELVIVSLYLIITVMFLTNFMSLVNKLIKKSKKVNKLSLLATSSLIFHSMAMSLFFMGTSSSIVLVSQIYLLTCMIYIRYFAGKKNNIKGK